LYSEYIRNNIPAFTAHSSTGQTLRRWEKEVLTATRSGTDVKDYRHRGASDPDQKKKKKEESIIARE
jgi:hypothetical protein